MEQLTKSDVWHLLQKHAEEYKDGGFYYARTMEEQQKCRIAACGIEINYANQHVTHKTLSLLTSLAQSCQLQEKITSLMNGGKVNVSEHKPAIHTALRVADSLNPIWVGDRNIVDDVLAVRTHIEQIAEKIRAKKWFGYTGEPITDVINIGIGGSDLGPRLCIKAFSDLSASHLGYHFISDADPKAFKLAVAKLRPETTLFIISSKSFTTQETLFNARKAKAWIGGDEARFDKHFIAVTANVEKASEFGIKHILPIWDWVGGRYSLCSAINLITIIAIGVEQFNQLLSGASSMDKHFKDAEFQENLPVLLGLLGVWNNNFLSIHNLLILTYSQYIEQFVPYIQQLDMESNGKTTDLQNQKIHYSTGPLVWGGPGNQAQHSYYQLLCQGSHRVAADLITFNEFDGQMINDMCDDKVRVLSQGVRNVLNHNDYIAGNVPLNRIRIDACTPYNMGALIALYEHKIYVQSVVWNINPFDQPGVESAKRSRLIRSEPVDVNSEVSYLL